MKRILSLSLCLVLSLPLQAKILFQYKVLLNNSWTEYKLEDTFVFERHQDTSIKKQTLDKKTEDYLLEKIISTHLKSSEDSKCLENKAIITYTIHDKMKAHFCENQKEVIHLHTQLVRIFEGYFERVH